MLIYPLDNEFKRGKETNYLFNISSSPSSSSSSSPSSFIDDKFTTTGQNYKDLQDHLMDLDILEEGTFAFIT